MGLVPSPRLFTFLGSFPPAALLLLDDGTKGPTTGLDEPDVEGVRREEG
jgi:hypothetical protein